jgi:hypothetical protein
VAAGAAAAAAAAKTTAVPEVCFSGACVLGLLLCDAHVDTTLRLTLTTRGSEDGSETEVGACCTSLRSLLASAVVSAQVTAGGGGGGGGHNTGGLLPLFEQTRTGRRSALAADGAGCWLAVDECAWVGNAVAANLAGVAAPLASLAIKGKGGSVNGDDEDDEEEEEDDEEEEEEGGEAAGGAAAAPVEPEFDPFALPPLEAVFFESAVEARARLRRSVLIWAFGHSARALALKRAAKDLAARGSLSIERAEVAETEAQHLAEQEAAEKAEARADRIRWGSRRAVPAACGLPASPPQFAVAAAAAADAAAATAAGAAAAAAAAAAATGTCLPRAVVPFHVRPLACH